jgi:hypothetical protein
VVRAVLRSPTGPKPWQSAWDSSHGVHSKIAPPPVNLARPLPVGPKPDLRPEAATLQTRSALVVPPDSDGLLRTRPRRSVAPCSRPWGSPRFRFADASPRRRPFPGGAGPSKLFPPWQPPRVAAVRSLSPLLARSPGCFPPVLPRSLPTPLSPVARPQGFAPPKSPLQAFRCCHRAPLDAPLGFPLFSVALSRRVRRPKPLHPAPASRSRRVQPCLVDRARDASRGAVSEECCIRRLPRCVPCPPPEGEGRAPTGPRLPGASARRRRSVTVADHLAGSYSRPKAIVVASAARRRHASPEEGARFRR